ncbi:hypothetical protein NDU88_002291 [Pleurodeles waltl]|uniref:Uncharacterized protein n=1 Tax=Pleurodeles waltl TaxID=8319 RepID=A0AAV7M2Z3_PLEWA|nr:hypothetical protein NDU88_002291 [Pleurodeles waltl]
MRAAAHVPGLGTSSRTLASRRRRSSGRQNQHSSQGSEGRPVADEAASSRGAATPCHTGCLGHPLPGRASEPQTRSLHLPASTTSPGEDTMPIKGTTPGRHVTAGSGQVRSIAGLWAPADLARLGNQVLGRTEDLPGTA